MQLKCSCILASNAQAQNAEIKIHSEVRGQFFYVFHNFGKWAQTHFFAGWNTEICLPKCKAEIEQHFWAWNCNSNKIGLKFVGSNAAEIERLSLACNSNKFVLKFVSSNALKLLSQMWAGEFELCSQLNFRHRIDRLISDIPWVLVSVSKCAQIKRAQSPRVCSLKPNWSASAHFGPPHSVCPLNTAEFELLF